MSYDLKKLFSARIAVLVLAVLIFSGASLQSSSAQDLFNRQGDGISGVENELLVGGAMFVVYVAPMLFTLIYVVVVFAIYLAVLVGALVGAGA